MKWYITIKDIKLTDLDSREGFTLRARTRQTAKYVGEQIIYEFGRIQFSERYVLDHPQLFQLIDDTEVDHAAAKK